MEKTSSNRGGLWGNHLLAPQKPAAMKVVFFETISGACKDHLPQGKKVTILSLCYSMAGLSQKK